MATTTFLQSSEVMARELFNGIVSGNAARITVTLTQILALKAEYHQDKRFLQVNVEEMARAFYSLKKLLVTSFYTRIVTKTKGTSDMTELMEEMTFSKMFDGIISKENWHNEIGRAHV